MRTPVWNWNILNFECWYKGIVTVCCLPKSLTSKSNKEVWQMRRDWKHILKHTVRNSIGTNRVIGVLCCIVLPSGWRSKYGNFWNRFRKRSGWMPSVSLSMPAILPRCGQSKDYLLPVIMHMWMNWCSKGRMQPRFCHFPLLLYKVVSRRDQIVGKRCESRS